MNKMQQVSLRQKAVFIPATAIRENATPMTGVTAIFVANLVKLGFGVTDELLRALNAAPPAFLMQTLNTLLEVTGVNKGWTPLVKGWDVPTGEAGIDHIVTYFTNLFKGKGTTLACGHVIPDNTFPLHRYNGCPFCGTLFIKGNTVLPESNGKLKVLELWTEKEAIAFLTDLLLSKTALDATQMDSLSILLTELELPSVDIAMKETRMAVIDMLVKAGKAAAAQPLFTSPVDVMRYLWYKHTGFLQIAEPGTIARRKVRNENHIAGYHKKGVAGMAIHQQLKLKYNRKECINAARWMNGINMHEEKMCELMHAKRSMWVRFIRALRLAEYSKRKGFEKLNRVLDCFYNNNYIVWQGMVDYNRTRYDAKATLALLKERPGMFARSLFSNMLWFGYHDTVAAFSQVVDKVPARLVFTLDMYAQNYFDKKAVRVVKPLGGATKSIKGNPLLDIYHDNDLAAMRQEVNKLCLSAVQKRFEAVAPKGKSIYIAPELFQIPMSIGDRSATVQDLPAVLMGTRFSVDGDNVRLFMQWGTGLPAQHLDMDLSCMVIYARKTERCSYSSLVITGCKHSGDIIHIPEKTGAAEYIELDIAALSKAGAEYVMFTCNAYSRGAISPNLVIGWMNSSYPMTISKTTGVAYNPAHVQHQARVVKSLDKGLVFGVLDVKKREIVWLEIPFEGQLVQNLNTNTVEAFLKKLESKITVGQLLTIKAAAQGLKAMPAEAADEVYTKEWAINTAAVTALLID